MLGDVVLVDLMDASGGSIFGKMNAGAWHG